MKPHKKYPFIKHITTSSLCLQWLLCVIIENDSLNIYCCSSSHLFTYLSSGNNVFWNIPKLFTIMTIKYSMKVHYNIPSSLWPTRTRPAMEDENMRLWPYFFSKTVLSATTVMLQSDTLTCSLVFVLQHTQHSLLMRNQAWVVRYPISYLIPLAVQSSLGWSFGMNNGETKVTPVYKKQCLMSCTVHSVESLL